MSTLTEFLTGIADAIRGKTGTSAPIPAQDFATEIAAIETGTDTSDATAGAAQILAPYTAYGANGKLTGTIPSQHATTITPGISAQTAIPAGTYAAGAATVAGDANLVADNIKEGVSIFGVQGSLAGGPEMCTLKFYPGALSGYATVQYAYFGMSSFVPFTGTGSQFFTVQVPIGSFLVIASDFEYNQRGVSQISSVSVSSQDYKKLHVFAITGSKAQVDWI